TDLPRRGPASRAASGEPTRHRTVLSSHPIRCAGSSPKSSPVSPRQGLGLDTPIAVGSDPLFRTILGKPQRLRRRTLSPPRQRRPPSRSGLPRLATRPGLAEPAPESCAPTKALANG